MWNIRDRSADAWGDFIEERIAHGWTPYFATFLFEPLPGGQVARVTQMAHFLEQAYAIFVTRVVRKPRAAAEFGALPVWLCSPDLPVYKRQKTILRNLVINDGLHYHVILLLPPWSRMSDVTMHFEEFRLIYRKRASLHHVDVEPIINRVRYVHGYSFKSIFRGSFDVGDHFVLPRSLREMSA